MQGKDLGNAIVDESTVYNQWTVFPDDYDPISAKLRFEPSPTGDFDGDGSLNMADVDAFIEMIRGVHHSKSSSAAEMFDVNIDGRIDGEDLNFWVKDLKKTWFGDADVNGEFNSADFVQVFQAGKYEQGWLGEWRSIHQGAGWTEGDWNGDGFFDSSDVVAAFVDGGFEAGDRSQATAMAIPEPATGTLVALCVIALPGLCRWRLRKSTLISENARHRHSGAWPRSSPRSATTLNTVAHPIPEIVTC